MTGKSIKRIKQTNKKGKTINGKWGSETKFAQLITVIHQYLELVNNYWDSQM